MNILTNKTAIRLALLLVLLLPNLIASAIASEPLMVDLLATMEFDDNLGRAERQNDQESDWALTLGAVVSRTLNLGERGALQLRGITQLIDQQDFGDLDRLGLSAMVRYVWQPGVEYHSPWFELLAEVGGERYADSDIRDNWSVGSGFGLGQRVTDRLDAHLGYRYNSRQPRRGEIFDTDQQRLFLRADLRLPKTGRVYGVWSFMQGDLTSSGELDPVILGVSTERGPDSALRTAAWQLDGTERQFELGILLPLGERINLDVSVIRSDATASSSIDYRRNRVQASLLSRF